MTRLTGGVRGRLAVVTSHPAPAFFRPPLRRLWVRARVFNAVDDTPACALHLFEGTWAEVCAARDELRALLLTQAEGTGTRLTGLGEPAGTADVGGPAQPSPAGGDRAAETTGKADPEVDASGAAPAHTGPATPAPSSAIDEDPAPDAPAPRLLGVVALPPQMAWHGPGLVVTDVDSTLIREEVIEELADAAGTRDQVAEVTARAMRGELDFADSLRERVATLAGVPDTVFADVLERITPTTGVAALIRAVHWRGGTFGVVSGGFEEVVAPLAARLRIDHHVANRLDVDPESGTLTGRVDGPIVTADVKVESLRAWAGARGIGRERTLAIGDGANDLAMLRAAGVGIAYCAKPAVRRGAPNVWDVPRLDVLASALS